MWLLVFSLILATVTPAGAQEQQTPAAGDILRVGIYSNPPLVSLGRNDEPEGLVIDLLEEVARREGLRIRYVTASFAELLELTQSRRIDLIAAIAYTPERA
ncbi:MAG TPA: transporter substrate-binding domain-containing protein, partial [Thioalkalivibrio sp.]|nr:transporter substrate-binding domain-containing protein [Thioalkalivibrio sp.]